MPEGSWSGVRRREDRDGGSLLEEGVDAPFAVIADFWEEVLRGWRFVGAVLMIDLITSGTRFGVTPSTNWNAGSSNTLVALSFPYGPSL